MRSNHRNNVAGEKIVAFLLTNIIGKTLLVYNLHQSLKFCSFDVSGKIIYGSYELTTTGLLFINDMSSNYWASRNGEKITVRTICKLCN